MSKPLECHIRLWGEDIGTIVHIDNKIYFQYENSFLEKGIDPSPIMMSTGANVEIFSFPELSYAFNPAIKFIKPAFWKIPSFVNAIPDSPVD